MIKVYFDDWATAAEDSGFFLNVEIIPRAGELIRFHRSVVGKYFLRNHEVDFDEFESSGSAIDGFGHFRVRTVEHRYGEGGALEITVDVEPEE